jgi:succinyl-CoA synthetase beta subunit
MGAQGFLNEADSLALLARHGVPTVSMRLCHSAQEARAAVDAVGAPAVVKACSAEVPHKTDHGLVALGVATREQAGELYERFDAKMTAMGVARDGVIVAATRKGRHEFMVGARVDPVFGPVVVVGDGGKNVEALKDCAVLLPPFSQEEVVRALGTLRIAPLLGGVRGDPPLDVQALAGIAVAVGQVIAGAGGTIASIDLNPVMVGAEGDGAIVVDALVECAAMPEHIR